MSEGPSREPDGRGVSLMQLIERAKKERVRPEEYKRLMERGLTGEQMEVAEARIGECVQLTGENPQTDDGGVILHTAFDALTESSKRPTIVTLDGVDFVVKAETGATTHPHSRWIWREDGYRFTFYRSETEDTAHSLRISPAE